jgi:clorobiocin biosynthesis protein CloN6
MKLPALRADFLLLHAPAFFDFRSRRDIYFPFLGTSGDVPITPLYEYFPVGFKTLQRYLTDLGHLVKIMNLSSVLLRYPKINVDQLIKSLDVKIVGIDLHWMVHVQGSLEVAKRIKSLRPDIQIIFGGISSTYFADQLIQYPFIDMVMRGYDTHVPVAQLLSAIKQGNSFDSIENLLWKSEAGVIHDNAFIHLPDTFACGIDWTQLPPEPKTSSLPIREVLSTQNAGCAFNCGWCGGSRDAFRRIFKRQKAMARKTLPEIGYEFVTMGKVPDIETYTFYSVGSYNEPKNNFMNFLDRVAETPFKAVSYEQYFLTPDDVLKRMVEANKRTIVTLSPESSDIHVAKLAGRGVYTNEQMEDWLEKALDYGVHQIDIWYFIGMPQQDAASVQRTVDYCRHLLKKFKNRPVNPMLCPMIPFLDPASTFFEYPDEHGYRVFHRTVEEHRCGMERASVLNRINYETKWLSRHDLVNVGFRAVKALMEAKGEFSALPKFCVRDYNAKIDDALAFIPVVHEVDNIANAGERARELEKLGDEIERRNQMIFRPSVMNQAFPVNREIGGRWFDEMGWDAETLEQANLGTEEAGELAPV